eukprot:TRINITY_DN92681_c0_g1_i1.p1 TRINITY_DN92681_c0_g1~~TRINITY_DN92681_c0_g1_i1.p1  ORF type:complete len:414 (+),score=75.45 TRINITY_DN92681_c0_g1_i1:79-1320(+)
MRSRWLHACAAAAVACRAASAHEVANATIRSPLADGEQPLRAAAALRRLNQAIENAAKPCVAGQGSPPQGCSCGVFLCAQGQKCSTMTKSDQEEKFCQAECSNSLGLKPSVMYPCLCGDISCVHRGELCNATTSTCIAVTPAGDGPEVLNFVIRVAEFAVVGLICLAIFACRAVWWPPLYMHTCAKCKCFHIRNVPAIGFCVANICRCWFSRYHPTFRLRIVIKAGWNLRQVDIVNQMQAYVKVLCGNNPDKNTSVARVPLSNSSHPVVWDDVVDIMVQTSDEFIRFIVKDHDDYSQADEIGEGRLAVADFYEEMDAQRDHSCNYMVNPFAWCQFGDGVRHVEDVPIQLLWDQKRAGEIYVSLYATARDTPLPRVRPGLGTQKAPTQQQPMMSDFMGLFGFSGKPAYMQMPSS